MSLSCNLPCLCAGEAARLRGINRSGFEYDRCGAGITRAEVEEIARGWGARMIRLPFNQEWALEDDGAYLERLDEAIEWTASCGAYTLLDLQWLNAGFPHGGNNFVPPLPNAGSLDLWALLARRYRDETAVLFDILNEPHDPLPDDPYPLISVSGELVVPATVTAEVWRGWAAALIELIRAVHPESVIYVSGIEWGYDLRGMVLPFENLVYSTHVYRTRGENWDAAFGHLAGRVPLFAGEWGGTGEDLEWGGRLAEYFSRLGMGWTAWSWSDHPRLQIEGEPTEFGRLVRDSLLR
jgi:endoglucanase